LSSIDQVIAAARRGGAGFSERKQFTLARSRAIEKMRKFALADPYFYALELIQGAVANGARYVDFECADGNITMSYVGGHLTEAELSQLFDFLFASKERLDFAHVRALALGINAALLFEPTRVIIESGDGTAKGTSRLVLEHGTDSVEVGRAAQPLGGTFLRFEGMNRRLVARKTGRKGDDDGSMEYGVIETRCLAAPVPIIFNGHPMFGFRQSRVPGLFGYKHALAFDEGDLYGILGHGTFGVPTFQILTWGVWVQSYRFELVPGKKLGGIVCFDRLHKTADHSGFVQDERMDEMWLRLRPYAEQLLSGRKRATLGIASMDGRAFTTPELRKLLSSAGRVVAIDPAAAKDDDQLRRAKAIARATDAMLLQVPAESTGSLRVFAGRNCEVLRPRLGDDAELRFYAQRPHDPPPEPYLVPPIGGPDLQVGELAQALVTRMGLAGLAAGDEGEPGQEGEEAGDARDDAIRSLAERLGTGPASVKIYVPEHPRRAAHGLVVDLLTAGRLVRSELRASAFPGHVLRVELGSASPSELTGPLVAADGEDEDEAEVEAEAPVSLAAAIADLMVERAVQTLGGHTDRLLEGLSVGELSPEDPAAKLALSALCRTCVARLRAARPGRLAPGAGFSLTVEIPGFDPLGLGLLRTHGGEAWSVRELGLRMDETAGLVYGTQSEVPADLEGLDRRHVLDLDPHTERLLVALVGESTYVRVDGRDVLASSHGVLCRDVAVGLRSYPDFPLLVEGEDPTARPEEERRRIVDDLVGQLRARVHGGTAPAVGAAREAWLEARRQALRHLQWYVCRRAAREPTLRDSLTAQPLFVDVAGRAVSLDDLLPALRAPAGVLVHYDHAMSERELDALASPREREGADEAEKAIAVSPFAYRLLLPLGKVRLAFDFDVDDTEAAGNPTTPERAFLVRVPVAGGGIDGVVGIPRRAVANPRVQVRDARRRCVHNLEELARELGVVGTIQLTEIDWEERELDVWRRVQAAGLEALSRLLDEFPDWTDRADDYLAAVEAILGFAGRELSLVHDPSRHGVAVTVRHPLAERVLALPLFATARGTPTSAQRLIERFCRDVRSGVRTDWGKVLDPAAAVPLRRWLDTTLVPDRIVHLPARPTTPGTDGAAEHAGPSPTGEALDDGVLAYNIEHWLHVLRPDKAVGSVYTRVWVADAYAFKYRPDALAIGGAARLDVMRTHPLVERARGKSPEALGWLLLACYAHLNAELEPVTNAHERAFQLEVTQALVSGELRVLDPPDGFRRARPKPDAFSDDFFDPW
jgi:hypothetical protein